MSADDWSSNGEKKKIDELARKARQWVASDRGREVIKRILADSKRAQEELAKARQIDPETLRKPVTI